jgi:hypothetical protein
MSEVSIAGEYHADALAVAEINGFLITDGTAWLDDGFDAKTGCFFH